MMQEFWSYLLQSGFFEFIFTYPGNIFIVFFSPIIIALVVGIFSGIRDFLSDLSYIVSKVFVKEE